MADFDDGLSPTWPNILGGHHTLIKALKRNLRFYDPDMKKEYSVKEIHSQVFMQPRSLRRAEEHVLIDNAPMSAAIFDITVYAFHNLTKLASEKLGHQSCYFYLPKIDFEGEAIFWNDILCHLETLLGAPP